MNLRRTLEGFFARWGVTCTIGEERFSAVLSPKGSEQSDFLLRHHGPAGAETDGDFLLMAPCGAASLKKGALLKSGGFCYTVRFAENYLLADEPVYRYAVLRRREEGGVGNA